VRGASTRATTCPYAITSPQTRRGAPQYAYQLFSHTKYGINNSNSPGATHADIKMENILISTGTESDTGTSTGTRIGTAAAGRLILTNFTCAAATPVPVLRKKRRALVARCGEQYSPAPELFRQSTASVLVPYAGPPVDVWGLGVILFSLVCRQAPFDGPTMDVLHEASLRSPAGLPFHWRVSRGVYARGGSIFFKSFSHACYFFSLFSAGKECRDLLRRMLQADPAARASLDEVLKHPWMSKKSACSRRNLTTGSLPSADGGLPTFAALKWPDEIDYKRFQTYAALDSGEGEEAWKCLTETLALVSRLCEAPSGARRHYPLISLLFRGIRSDYQRAGSLFAKLRPVAPDWTSLFQASGKRRTKVGVL
jgi:serine/threonine protein kinase